MPIKNNIKNDRSCLNLLWCFNFNKFGLIDKILSGKQIEIEDMILNNDEFPNAQNSISWALTYPENPYRLTFHFKEDLFPEHISTQQREDVKQKCREAFNRFKVKLEEERVKITNNSAPVEIVEFKDLCKDYLSPEEINNNNILKAVLDGKMKHISNVFDSIRLITSYYGFGYDKNLLFDMDITPESIGENGEVDNFDSELKFSISSPGLTYEEARSMIVQEKEIATDEKIKELILKSIRHKGIEINLYYIKSSKNTDIEYIMNAINKLWTDNLENESIYRAIYKISELKYFKDANTKQIFLEALQKTDLSDLRNLVYSHNMVALRNKYDLLFKGTGKEEMVFSNSRKREGTRSWNESGDDKNKIFTRKPIYQKDFWFDSKDSKVILNPLQEFKFGDNNFLDSNKKQNNVDSQNKEIKKKIANYFESLDKKYNFTFNNDTYKSDILDLSFFGGFSDNERYHCYNVSDSDVLSTLSIDNDRSLDPLKEIVSKRIKELEIKEKMIQYIIKELPEEEKFTLRDMSDEDTEKYYGAISNTYYSKKLDLLFTTPKNLCIDFTRILLDQNTTHKLELSDRGFDELKKQIAQKREKLCFKTDPSIDHKKKKETTVYNNIESNTINNINHQKYPAVKADSTIDTKSSNKEIALYAAGSAIFTGSCAILTTFAFQNINPPLFFSGAAISAPIVLICLTICLKKLHNNYTLDSVESLSNGKGKL